MDLTVVEADRVCELISMPEAIDAVRCAFVALSGGDFEMPPRIHMNNGAYLVMPCHHRPTGSAIVKTLSINFERKPAIAGSVLWTSIARGECIVADAGAVTALRTAAATGVATDLLAPPRASSCTMIGTGIQAHGQLRAVNVVRPITRLLVVDVDQAKAEQFAADVTAELGLTDVHVYPNAREAVGSADIVCCATNAREPLFDAADLPDIVHVNAIGAYRPDMRELPDSLLAEGLIVIDEAQSILEESGEVIHAINSGVLQASQLVELGAALREGVRRRDRTVFKTVGVAAQDWAIADLLAEKILTP